jgi:hypothetical protein
MHQKRGHVLQIKELRSFLALLQFDLFFWFEPWPDFEFDSAEGEAKSLNCKEIHVSPIKPSGREEKRGQRRDPTNLRVDFAMRLREFLLPRPAGFSLEALSGAWRKRDIG